MEHPTPIEKATTAMTTNETPDETDTSTVDEQAHTDLRYIRDVIDGEPHLSIHEVTYLVPDLSRPDQIEVIDVSPEPVKLVGSSPRDINNLLNRAGLARFKPMLPGITGWRLEHREDDPRGLLTRVHDEKVCAERNCTIHHRSDHHMRQFPQLWRGDAGFMERVCSHHVGHPDPDETPANRERVHGCCGCCTNPDA